MTNLKDLITTETRKTFERNSIDLGTSSERKQISLRPEAVLLVKLDTLADRLEMSRQQLADLILEQGVEDAIDAYCEAHGPEHRDNAEDAFRKAAVQRLTQQQSEGHV